MTLELAILRAARPQLDPTRQALLQRVEALEQRVGAGNPSTPETKPEEPNPGPDELRVEKTPSPNELDFERISGLWPAVLDQVRESGSELLSTVFAAARPVAVDVEQAVLKVGFPASAAFNKRKAEAQDARERFAEAVRTIVGERLRPVYVMLDGDEDAGDDAEPQLSEEELIERLKSEFDAEEFEGDENLGAEEAR
jgi:hypothetical protein